MTVQLLSHVRAVTPTGVLEDATVAVEDGDIVAVEDHRSYAGAIDGRDAYCLPGLIDPHCDAIEREISPRPTAVFDAELALLSLEQRFLGSGITTAFHGIHFADDSDKMRDVETSVRLVETIAARRKESPRLDHRVLFRAPARNIGSVARAQATMAANDVGAGAQLLSFEDHTPGQGQYRDLAVYKAAMRNFSDASDEEAEAEIARRIADGQARESLRSDNLALVERMVGDGQARALAHDCVDEQEVETAHAWGAKVAEFPVTMSAARRARGLGMPVVLGAPNVLLGGSHTGNVSAEAVIAEGLCTALASDYFPPSLLAAAFDLADRGVVGLHTAVGLVTSGAAQATGLPCRAVTVGATADLILVAQRGRWPTVLNVLQFGQETNAGGRPGLPAFV